MTMLELLIVVIVLAILLAVAVPAYLKFRDRANNSAVQGNIRAMLPAMEAYSADNNGYTGMQIGGSGASSLQFTYDKALKLAPTVTILSKTASTYCVRSIVGNATAYKFGPAASIVVNPSTPTCS
jgi:type IV pilus assembly protein PilA